MRYNADAKIRWPSLRQGTDGYTQTPQETDSETLRVSLNPMSRNEQVTCLGGLTIGAYNMRFRYAGKRQFAAGQVIEAKLDVEDEWRNYTVRVPGGHWPNVLLAVERV